MRNLDVKIKILTDNLDRKKELLKQIEAITEKQEMFFTTLKGEDRNYMLEEAVKDALGKTIMVSSKDDHVVYKEAMGEADEVAAELHEYRVIEAHLGALVGYLLGAHAL